MENQEKILLFVDILLIFSRDCFKFCVNLKNGYKNKGVRNLKFHF